VEDERNWVSPVDGRAYVQELAGAWTQARGGCSGVTLRRSSSNGDHTQLRFRLDRPEELSGV
jgi:hypothetical protein